MANPAHRAARKVSATERKALAEAKAQFKTPSAMARKLRLTLPGLLQWDKHGIPLHRVEQLAKLTGIPQWRLRPDFYKRPAAQEAGP